MRKFVLVLLVAAVAWGAARPAFAILQFFKVWDEVYLSEHEDKEFVETVRSPKVRCFVCHQGKSRKNHNPYGIHLVEPLDKRKHIRDPETVKKVLAEVGAMHIDPDDENSPTYDELIQQSILPGGTLEEVMEEPEEPAESP
jgi:hypothetical protein